MTFDQIKSRLREARGEQGLTASEVAQRAGIGLSALRNYEVVATDREKRRNPTPEVLTKWARALGMEFVLEVRRPASDLARAVEEAATEMDDAQQRALAELVRIAAKSNAVAIRHGASVIRIVAAAVEEGQGQGSGRARVTASAHRPTASISASVMCRSMP